MLSFYHAKNLPFDHSGEGPSVHSCHEISKICRPVELMLWNDELLGSELTMGINEFAHYIAKKQGIRSDAHSIQQMAAVYTHKQIPEVACGPLSGLPHPLWQRRSESTLKTSLGPFAGTPEAQQGQLEETSGGGHPSTPVLWAGERRESRHHGLLKSAASFSVM